MFELCEQLLVWPDAGADVCWQQL